MMHLASALLLAFLTSAQLGGAPVEPKVLILGLDGTRWDCVERARTPNIDAIIRDGCWTDRCHTGSVTVSGPGWSSILTGVWMDKHSVIDNGFQGAAYERYPHMFVRLKEALPGARTASFVSWLPLAQHGLTTEANTDHMFVQAYDEGGDATLTERAEQVLPELDADAIFFYFADIDVAGHAHGFHPDVPEYIAEIEEVDGQIGRIVGALRARPTAAREDWLILMTTDHSGTLDGAHGRDEEAHRRMWFVASGPAAGRGEIRRTVNQTDIVATALRHLGVNADVAQESGWGLDSVARGLASPADARFGVNLITNPGAEIGFVGNQDQQVNRGLAGWADLGPMTAIAYGSPDGFPDLDSAGPDDRGRALFCGGSGGDSAITQTIDISDFAGDVDSGVVVAELSGWFGGYQDQRDLALLRARFLDDHWRPVAGAVAVGPVTVEQRRDESGAGVTGMWFRSREGVVPPGTRIVELTLSAAVGSGANDGYADNLSFVLERSD